MNRELADKDRGSPISRVRGKKGILLCYVLASPKVCL